MSNRTYDRLIEHQNYVEETCCCECGFHRNGQHHPKIRCPKTGRCGECGNDWPCEEHAQKKMRAKIKVCEHGGRESSCPLCFKDKIAAKMKGTTIDEIQRQKQERIKSFTTRRETDRGYYPPDIEKEMQERRRNERPRKILRRKTRRDA